MIDPLSLAKLAGVPVKVYGLNATPYAIVKDGVVVNVTRWASAEAPDWKPAEGEAVPCGSTVGIGHLWDGEAFTDPNAKPKVLIPLDEAKARRIAEIDRAFRDASGGLFVDDAKREAMRAEALAAVEKVKAAATREKAQAIKTAAVSELQASI